MGTEIRSLYNCVMYAQSVHAMQRAKQNIRSAKTVPDKLYQVSVCSLGAQVMTLNLSPMTTSSKLEPVFRYLALCGASR
jgi:hypothetical protein